MWPLRPIFVEYGNYVRNYDERTGGVVRRTQKHSSRIWKNFPGGLDRTKAVIINTPNNPTGNLFRSCTDAFGNPDRKGKEFGTQIVLIFWQPYRGNWHIGQEVPYVTKFCHVHGHAILTANPFPCLESVSRMSGPGWSLQTAKYSMRLCPETIMSWAVSSPSWCSTLLHALWMRQQMRP